MKQLRFILAALLLMVCGTIAHAQKVVVYKSDGTKVEYNASDVKEVKYEKAEVDYGYYGWIDTNTAMKATEFTSSMFNKHLTADLPLTITDTTQFTGNYFIIALPNSNVLGVNYESTLGSGTLKVNTGTEWQVNNTVSINGKSFYVFIITTPISTTTTKLNIAIN